MQKSIAMGAVVVLAVGIVAAHSTRAALHRPTAQAAVTESRPMSPLQLMRRDRASLDQADLQAAF